MDVHELDQQVRDPVLVESGLERRPGPSSVFMRVGSTSIGLSRGTEPLPDRDARPTGRSVARRWRVTIVDDKGRPSQ